MSRISIPARDDVPRPGSVLMPAEALGVVPNMYCLIALSPAAPQGFAANNGAPTKRSTSRRASGSPWP